VQSLKERKTGQFGDNNPKSTKQTTPVVRFRCC